MDHIPTEAVPVRSTDRVPLRIATLGRRGRGVLADAPIGRGELVERSPVLVIPHVDRAATDGTIVFTYVFMWEHDTVEEDLYRHEGRAAIALGFTSLLNHAYAPNCEFIRRFCQSSRQTARLAGWGGAGKLRDDGNGGGPGMDCVA